MGDIYATPESDVVQRSTSKRGGGNIEDAIDGKIDVNMLAILGEAWRDLRGFKLKCHIAGNLVRGLPGGAADQPADNLRPDGAGCQREQCPDYRLADAVYRHHGHHAHDGRHYHHGDTPCAG